MARILIVGCGCRGRVLAGVLREDGHAVRGTTRDPARLPEIEEAGAEAVVADPDRLGTVLAQLRGVTAVCWLMGTAAGDGGAALNSERLPALTEKLVDSGVRGLVYEAQGTADSKALAVGAAAVRRAQELFRIPAAMIDAQPADHAAWLEAASIGVVRVLSA